MLATDCPCREGRKHEEAVHNAFKQLEEALPLQEAGPGPQGNFSHLDIYWKNNMAVHK